MSDNSTIEWTQATWNPVTGCDKASPGCDHCYALTMAKRLKAMGQAKYQRDGDPRTSGPGFGVTEHPDSLTIPIRWRKPQKVFVNSMSDLFHPRVSDEFIARVLAVIALTPQHTYQLLTKRSARMRAFLANECGCHAAGVELRSAMAWAVSEANPDRIPGCGTEAERIVYSTAWPLRNLWVGVSAENQQWADIRIPALLETPAVVRWVSAEPLLGQLDLTQWMGLECGCGTPPVPGMGMSGCSPDCMKPMRRGLSWVVLGGESGPDARPMQPDWARTVRNQCIDANVPFLFKQWGGRTPKANGRLLDGRVWDQYPQTAEAAESTA